MKIERASRLEETSRHTKETEYVSFHKIIRSRPWAFFMTAGSRMTFLALC